MQNLALETDGAVAALVVDRANKHNAFTQEMWHELPQILAKIHRLDDVRVLLIRSATPGIFCAGADVNEYREHAGDAKWGIQSQDRVARALASIRAIPVPTVAVIDGPCVGGGAGIALACDFRLSTERSAFAITPAKLGLVFPFEDIAALIALVGAADAKQMLFTGRRFDPHWALRTGFVNELHPSESIDAAAAELAAELASVAPGSVRGMKQMIAAVQAGHRESTPATDRIVAEALVGDDHLEGVTAFLERRPAHFRGRPSEPAP